MFAPEKVEERLDALEQEFGWRPRPHSLEEVDYWSKKLSTAFENVRGQNYKIRNLTKAEKHFIENERLMCAASCLYFITRYYYIKARNKITRFSFRQGQWVLWQMLCELDRMGRAKMLQILKARQLGISTLAEGMATWASLFIPGVAANIGSADDQKTQIMMGMMTLAIDQLPPWLPPTQTRSKTASGRGLIEFAKIGSLIMVQHGAMRGGMGQGATPTFVHLSEVSQFTDPVTQLDEGLFKTLHVGPELVVMLESTGDASHKSSWWWKKQWIANRDNYWSGNSRFLPVFLPWHTTPELYPGDYWIKEFPVREDFTPDEDTIAHVRRAEAYVRNTPMLAKVLGSDWTMPIEQQWFWQFNHLDHKCRNVEKSWYRQMPCDDYEALLGEQDKIVDDLTIGAMNATKVDEPAAYAIVGSGITESHEPKESEIWYGDNSPPRLRCNWKTPQGIHLDWMMVPLQKVESLKFDPMEKLLIFEEWEPGFDYSVGCDTGTGVGGDRTIINVTKHGSDEYPDIQVAEFASDSIPAAEIAGWIAAVAAYYSKGMKEKPHPKICIETVRKYGDLPLHQVKEMGFRRQHEWGQGFDRKLWKEKVSKHGMLGWRTNVWSRPMLLSAFFSAVTNGWYVVRSKWLAEEIAAMEQKTTDSGKTRADHAAGEHDDRVFAAAMAYFTLHQRDVMAIREKKRYESPQDGDIIIETGPCRQEIVIPGKAWMEKGMAKSA